LADPVASADVTSPRLPDATRQARVPALDAARALGVVAMVAGHTLDALLSPVARSAPWAVEYWKARGFTAPLFLLVSGWAVSLALPRGRARGLELARGRLGRVALLLGIGLALRWPGWDVAGLVQGDGAAWAHLLAFDALHTIALALLAAALVFGLPLRPREQAGVFAALALLAVSLGMAAPAPALPAVADLPSNLVALAVAQACGGTSAFPIFPWSGYFFAGAVLGVATGRGGARASVATGAMGGALVCAALLLEGNAIGVLPPGDPVLFVFRVGVVLLVVSALALVPAALAARAAPLGRVSLAVYAIHVPIVYGWSTQAGLAARVGPTLGPAGAVLAAAAVLAASVLVARSLDPARSAARVGLRWARGRCGAVLGSFRAAGGAEEP
jgi:acyltransferase